MVGTPRRQIFPVSRFRCNVSNCGDGHCVHEVTAWRCPQCQQPLILVRPTGHMFCPDWDRCGFEAELSGANAATDAAGVRAVTGHTN